MKKMLVVCVLSFFMVILMITSYTSRSASATTYDDTTTCGYNGVLKSSLTSNQDQMNNLNTITNTLYDKLLSHVVFGITVHDDSLSVSKTVDRINVLNEYVEDNKYTLPKEMYIQAYADGYGEKFIKYLNDNGGQGRYEVLKAYADENKLEASTIYYYKTVMSSIYEGCTSTDIDLESSNYQQANPYSAKWRGQCTWFAWGRVREKTGIELPGDMGNGGDWYESAKSNKSLSLGDVPKENSIIVLSNDNAGHVAIIESVDNGMIRITEGNYNNPCMKPNATCDMVDYAFNNYAELVSDRVVSVEDLNNGVVYPDLNIVGYIYF